MEGEGPQARRTWSSSWRMTRRDLPWKVFYKTLTSSASANGAIKRSSNSKYALWITLRTSFSHQRMETLLDYLLIMPPDLCSHDRGHKHPFTVSELFAQEVGQINDLFFTPPP